MNAKGREQMVQEQWQAPATARPYRTFAPALMPVRDRGDAATERMRNNLVREQTVPLKTGAAELQLDTQMEMPRLRDRPIANTRITTGQTDRKSTRLNSSH